MLVGTEPSCAGVLQSEGCHRSGIPPPRSETSLGPGVQFSDVVEEGRVEYAPVVSPALDPRGPSKIRASPSKRKRKISRGPVKLSCKFVIVSPPHETPQKRSLAEDPKFASTLTARAFRGKSRQCGRDRCAAPFIQMGFP